MKKIIPLFLLLITFYSCTPMKSSPKEEKHQLELTLHEVQTNLDDLRHDLNCFHTEMQIIDGKIKRQESTVQAMPLFLRYFSWKKRKLQGKRK